MKGRNCDIRLMMRQFFIISNPKRQMRFEKRVLVSGRSHDSHGKMSQMFSFGFALI